jgi:hypothetical protein
MHYCQRCYVSETAALNSDTRGRGNYSLHTIITDKFIEIIIGVLAV